MEYKGLIAGLGNPGPKYERTRHNMGFLLVDHVVALAAGRKSMDLKVLDESGDYRLWSVRLSGARLLLAQPQTYMNLSGRAVGRICGRHGLSADGVVVVHDELDLVLGRMKMKRGGGNNGHNGLESIQEVLGTPDFHRLRIGIGRPQFSSQVTDWVLGEFGPEEWALVREVVPAAWKGLDLFFRRGPALGVQFLSRFAPAPAADSEESARPQSPTRAKSGPVESEPK